MRTFGFMLVVFGLLLTSVVVADDKKPAAKKGAGTIQGYVFKVLKNAVVVDVTDPKTNKHSHISGYVDEHTTYTIDDKPAGHDDVVHGMAVVITMRTKQIADSVAAQSLPPETGK